MKLREKFTPMCFLSALGAGGLSVSFFMYLMFLVPHEGVPMATFDFIMPKLLEGTWLSFVIAFSLVFILVFAYFHFKLLIWNTKQFNLFKKTDKYKDLVNSNAEITLMTMPLTYAMTINVCFVLGAVFVPNLWSIVEYMFPFALLGFAIAGYFGLKIFMNYFSRLLIKGDFDFTKNNNLSQMISIFAFAMIAVGFAAPGAMSHNITINAIGIFAAIFFASVSILLLIIKLTMGFKNMFEHGISIEASPSLWIILPILTLLGITAIRVTFGLHHNFETVLTKSSLFTLTATIVSLQIIFGLLGYKVMKQLGYFEKYVHGNEKSPVSFALICPGVAFFVFGMFFVNFGLTFNTVIAKYSLAYFLLMLPFIYIQIKTIVYFFKLKTKFEF
ncbi:TsoY family (seleno)protein [Arcobacter sp. YIC-310]|uniref:TsoY family (seleno)protein n=1 Tax=Arcobacter sp. YIC-310 TaxID=3376632 RepID=UPI003C28C5F2